MGSTIANDEQKERQYVGAFIKTFGRCLEQLSSLESLVVWIPSASSYNTSCQRDFSDTILLNLRYNFPKNLAALSFMAARANENYISTSPRYEGVLATIIPKIRYFRTGYAVERQRRPRREPEPRLCRSLKHATNLVYLELTDLRHAEDVSFYSLSKNAPLRCLKLKYMTVDGPDLLWLLQSHRQTMRCIELLWVKLSTGIWNEIFRELTDHHMLSRVSIKNCGYSDWVPFYPHALFRPYNAEDKDALQESLICVKATGEDFAFPGE